MEIQKLNERTLSLILNRWGADAWRASCPKAPPQTTPRWEHVLVGEQWEEGLGGVRRIDGRPLDYLPGADRKVWIRLTTGEWIAVSLDVYDLATILHILVTGGLRIRPDMFSQDLCEIPLQATWDVYSRLLSQVGYSDAPVTLDLENGYHLRVLAFSRAPGGVAVFITDTRRANMSREEILKQAIKMFSLDIELTQVNSKLITQEAEVRAMRRYVKQARVLHEETACPVWPEVPAKPKRSLTQKKSPGRPRRFTG
jgi:hypothetical protein